MNVLFVSADDGLAYRDRPDRVAAIVVDGERFRVIGLTDVETQRMANYADNAVKAAESVIAELVDYRAVYPRKWRRAMVAIDQYRAANAGATLQRNR